MPAITVLIKPASGMCNMQCDYCFYCDEAQKRKHTSYGFMTEETLKNIIRKTILRAEGAVTYAFQGGEPTLRGLDFFEKVLEYEEHYNRNHIKVYNAIQTNGYLIDDQWCQFLKRHQFLVGVSVDGTRNVHDNYRHDASGKPTYDKIRNNIRRMEKYGVDFNILTVVTEKIADYIEEIYHEYQKNGWHYQQYIACLDPLNEERAQRSYALTLEKYGLFLTKLFNLWYSDWKKGKQPFIRQLENYVGILAGYVPEACNQRGNCSMQTVCEADGSVFPCDFYVLDEFLIGNFNQDRPDEIINNAKKNPLFERSHKIDPVCLECKYYQICRGGCQRERVYQEQTDTYHNYFCSSFQYFFDHCLERLQEMAMSLHPQI